METCEFVPNAKKTAMKTLSHHAQLNTEINPEVISQIKRVPVLQANSSEQ